MKSRLTNELIKDGISPGRGGKSRTEIPGEKVKSSSQPVVQKRIPSEKLKRFMV